MPITQAQIQAAEQIQHSAAHDLSPQVRLIAGPGTGKSSAIEERVRWLLSKGTAPEAICAVSFTRASTLDLRVRIQSYCAHNGQPAATRVRVSTLHSLALRTLRAAGLLTAYPSDPLVMDNWEVQTVFDGEFRHIEGIGKTRCEDIRREHEAFWSTGQWDPPNYIPSNPPISAAERTRFQAYHGPRAQTYSCVLPGEIIRQCVSHMRSGTLDPVALLNIKQLIIDEYQDLNPMDLEFVDFVVAKGAIFFVAGDDDQSIYSFRYASPSGIQNFNINYPNYSPHFLTNCFRCTPTVLNSGQSLISANPGPDRITKNLVSLYSTADPPVQGITHLWNYPSGISEARGIAKSCSDLIQAGMNPREILVLLSNRHALGSTLSTEFQTAGVSFEPPRADSFLDSQAGRLALSLLRIVCEQDDYVAHRVFLGLLPGVGIGTCNTICEAVIRNNMNYRDVFYQSLPTGVFRGRAVNALNRARVICSQLSTWQAADIIGQRMADISAIISNMIGQQDTQNWQNYASAFPAETTLEELRNLLWADTDEQQTALLTAVYERLNLTVPIGGLMPQRVRVMTMHGAKGLSARIVFIPGLEEETLPGPRRKPYPGLVMEAARLLYVSITRSRAACVMSYAGNRIVNGQFSGQTPSRFCTQLGGAFSYRTTGLTNQEVQQIMNTCTTL